jgi:hypothetical protein
VTAISPRPDAAVRSFLAVGEPPSGQVRRSVRPPAPTAPPIHHHPHASGLPRPTSGTAIVGGLDVGTDPGVKRRIGYISQKFSLYEIALDQNIQFSAASAGCAASATRSANSC